MSKKKILITSDLVSACFFTLIEQVMVASSTIWIVSMGRSLSLGDKGKMIFFLILFALSLTLVYIPSTLSCYFETKAHFSAYRNYIHLFSETYTGRTRLKNSSSLKEERQPYLNYEAMLVIGNLTFFINGTFSLILNLLFNISLFVFLVDTRFLFAYLIIVALLIIFRRLTKNPLALAGKKRQSTRASLLQMVSQGWEIFLTGNSYNLNLWREHYNGRFKKADKENRRFTFLTEAFTSCFMALSLLPIMGVLIYSAMEGWKDTGYIMALIATFPRQIQLIQYLGDIVGSVNQFEGIKAEVKGLFQAATLPHPLEKYHGTIHWEGLEFYTGERTKLVFSSIDPILKKADNHSAERITIRGANGCGKSTLLFELKERLGDKAFLYSPGSPLIFCDTFDKSLSSGENIAMVFDEISRQVECGVLLLDEWDANLDDLKKKNLDKKIDLISQSRLVIEVRHRE